MATANRERRGITQYLHHSGSPAFANHVIDASNDAVGFVFSAPTADPITHGLFRYGARAGTPVAHTITLEGVSLTTGQPDGADVGGGSPTAATFTPPADTSWDGLVQRIAFTNSFTPTPGAEYAMTIRPSGTPDGTNNSSITTDVSLLGSAAVHGFPYATRLTAGTWAKRVAFPIFGLESSSGDRWGNLLQAIFSTRSASTVGHRQACRFVLPGSSTYRVRGMRFTSSLSTAGGKNPLAKIWSASAALQSKTLDTDVWAGTTNYVHEVLFPDPLATLTGGTVYYAGLEVADSASGGVLLYGGKFSSASDLTSLPFGTEWYLATFDGSTWTHDTTVRPWLELILEDVTEPTGGSTAYVIGG